MPEVHVVASLPRYHGEAFFLSIFCAFTFPFRIYHGIPALPYAPHVFCLVHGFELVLLRRMSTFLWYYLLSHVRCRS